MFPNTDRAMTYEPSEYTSIYKPTNLWQIIAHICTFTLELESVTKPATRHSVTLLAFHKLNKITHTNSHMQGFYCLQNGAVALGQEALDAIYLLGCQMIRKSWTRKQFKGANFAGSLHNTWKYQSPASGVKGLKFIATFESDLLPNEVHCHFLIHPETLMSECEIKKRQHRWAVSPEE